MAHSRTQQAINLNSIRAKTTELAMFSGNPTATGTGAPEITGGGYSRVSISFTSPQAVSDGTYVSNTALISFPQATGDWSAPASYWAVFEVAGPMLNYGAVQELGVNTSRVVRVGDIFRVAANTLTIKEQD